MNNALEYWIFFPQKLRSDMQKYGKTTIGDNENCGQTFKVLSNAKNLRGIEGRQPT